MATQWDAIKTMISDMEDTMTFNLTNRQIETDPDEIIANAIDEYLNNSLVYTWDINELWIDLQCPEPDEMGDTISSSIMYAINQALRESDTVRSELWDTLEEWTDSRIADLQVKDVADDMPLDEKLVTLSDHEI